MKHTCKGCDGPLCTYCNGCINEGECACQKPPRAITREKSLLTIAYQFAIENKVVSISMLQRYLRCGHAHAGRIIVSLLEANMIKSTDSQYYVPIIDDTED